MPSISVLIPSYNHADYVAHAVGSALAAPVKDLEVIVIDDGSTDDTPQRLEAYVADPRVRLYRQDNIGAHAALNRALDLARGEILFVLNSDDAFHRDRIPRLVAHLASHPGTALVTTWIRIVDHAGLETGIKRGWSNLPPWPPPTRGPYLSELRDPTLSLLETNYISTSSNLAFRRELVVQGGIRFFPLRYAHDWDFALAASHRGRIDLVEEPLIDYRVHGSNTIAEGSAESAGRMRFEILWVVARHAYQVLQKSNTDLAMDDLVRLAWNSMPSFGCDAVLDQLLVLRGTSPDPPPAYDGLLDAGQPFREAAVQALASAP